ncbi:MAG: FAD-dependent oxidoreductase [Streptosporangiaceae bacterium]
MAEEYDVIVIGAGAAGEHASGRCTDAGLRTAVVEHELVGGECSYWACMPSKTLLRPGQVITAARRVPGAAQAVTGDLDVGKALARRDWMTAGWDDKNQADWLAGVGATLVRGRGRLAGERCVEVEARDGSRRRLSAARAVILATGSTAAVPPVEGLREIRIWDNRQVTSAKHVPDRLLVLGGGPVGTEMAQGLAPPGQYRGHRGGGSRAAAAQRGAIRRGAARQGPGRRGHNHHHRGQDGHGPAARR